MGAAGAASAEVRGCAERDGEYSSGYSSSSGGSSASSARVASDAAPSPIARLGVSTGDRSVGDFRNATSNSTGSALSGGSISRGTFRMFCAGMRRAMLSPLSRTAIDDRLAAVTAAAVAERSAAENDVEICAFFFSREACSSLSSTIFSTISIIVTSEPAQHLNSCPLCDSRSTSGFSTPRGVLIDDDRRL